METLLSAWPTERPLPEAEQWLFDPQLKTILGIAWSHGRIQRPAFTATDLSALDLSDADLFGIQFAGCALRKLRAARMNGVVLIECDLRGADLAGANLAGAFIHDSDLRGATLAGARLLGAEFSWCSLKGADLSTAEMTGADFWRCDIPPTPSPAPSGPRGEGEGFEEWHAREGDLLDELVNCPGVLSICEGTIRWGADKSPRFAGRTCREVYASRATLDSPGEAP
jgi:hypothetical protein